MRFGVCYLKPGAGISRFFQRRWVLRRNLEFVGVVVVYFALLGLYG